MVPQPSARGPTINSSASAPVAEVVAEPGIEPGTNMLRKATIHERANLGPQVLDQKLRIVVTCVTATPRVQLLMPPSKAHRRAREVSQAERQLCSAVSLWGQPKLLRVTLLPPDRRIHARFHGVAAHEVKDELLHLTMEDPEALSVRHTAISLQRRLSYRIPHETILPHQAPHGDARLAAHPTHLLLPREQVVPIPSGGDPSPRQATPSEPFMNACG